MKLAALALVAPSAVCAQQDTAAPASVDWIAQLPPRAKLAGLDGFQSVSTIEFDAEGERPHRIEATYVFPGRVRWSIAPVDAAPGERNLVYRCGRAFFFLEPGQNTSVALLDTEAERAAWTENCVGTELRRALFLWPDGFEWKGEGVARSAVTECGAPLEAQLGSDGRPASMRVGGDGAQRESFRRITWRESRGRAWPSTFELFVEEQRMWRERIESVETQVRLIDLFFAPPDRRRALATQATLQAQVRHADMPEGYRMRVALDGAWDWSEAARVWRERVERFASDAADAWRLEPGALVELDEHGRPSALWLRFRAGSGTPPEGLTRWREHSALLVGLSGSGIDFAAALGALRSALPAGAKAGLAYARFPGAPNAAGPLQVVQALEGGD